MADMLSFLFSSQFMSKLMVLPGEIMWMLEGGDFMLFLFITIMMPLDLGFRGLCECMK